MTLISLLQSVALSTSLLGAPLLAATSLPSSIRTGNEELALRHTPIGTFFLPSPLSFTIKAFQHFPVEAPPSCQTLQRRMATISYRHCTDVPGTTASSRACVLARQQADYARYERPDGLLSNLDTLQSWGLRTRNANPTLDSQQRSATASALQISENLVRPSSGILAEMDDNSFEVVPLEGSAINQLSRIKGLTLKPVTVTRRPDGSIVIQTEGREIACDLISGKAILKAKANVKINTQGDDTSPRQWLEELWGFRSDSLRTIQTSGLQGFRLGVHIGRRLSETMASFGPVSSAAYQAHLVDSITRLFFSETDGVLIPMASVRDLSGQIQGTTYGDHPLVFHAEL